MSFSEQKTRRVDLKTLSKECWLFEEEDKKETIFVLFFLFSLFSFLFSHTSTQEEEGSLIYATPHKLLQRITSHTQMDTDTQSLFLLTYRSLMTSVELMRLLRLRFDSQPPKVYVCMLCVCRDIKK